MEKKDKPKKKFALLPSIIFTIAISVIVFCIVYYATKPKTITTGEYPDDYKSVSLTCNIEELNYPIFTFDYADKKSTEVKILFDHRGVSTFYLRHVLYYTDQSNVIGSEAHNIASLYKSFAADGMRDGALGSNFSKLDGKMQFTLFAPKKDMDQVSYKYFLLDRNAEGMTTPEEFRNIYEKQGFNCSVSE